MHTTHIALCSDTHFWPGATQCFGNRGSQMQPWSQTIQATLLTEIAAVNPDLVIHLGDFTCGGGSFEMPTADFNTTLSDLIETFKQLPADFIGLPGNHDAPLGEKWSLAESLLDLQPGLGRTIDTPHARLIFLNAQGHDQAQIDVALPKDPTAGWVAPTELARLEADLATAAGRPVILFMHQLLFQWAGDRPWADLYGIANGDEVLHVLTRHPHVRAIFQGHAHRLDVHQVAVAGEPLWSVVLPAVIEYPMAWLEIELGADAIAMKSRRLPLPDLAAASRQSDDMDWRAGRAEWQQLTLSLR